MAIAAADLKDLADGIVGSTLGFVEFYYNTPSWLDTLEASDPLTGTSVANVTDLDDVLVADAEIQDDWRYVVYYDATDNSSVVCFIYNTVTREVIALSSQTGGDYWYPTLASVQAAFTDDGAEGFFDAILFPRVTRQPVASFVTGGEILYTQAPEWFDAMVAGTSLTAYTSTLTNWSDLSDVWISKRALGVTGWYYAVYHQETSHRHAAAFIYNPVSKEVVVLYETYSTAWTTGGGGTLYFPRYYYPTQDDVLQVFTEGGTSGFFTAIGKTRTTYGISESSPNEAVSWTPYHDSLAAELASLTSQYGWQDSTDISARVVVIRNELAAVSGTINTGTRQSELKDMIDEFQAAKDEATEANEFRYDQLLANASGTGETPTSPMSYPQLAQHMLDEYFTTLSGDHEDLQADQGTRDDGVSADYHIVWNLLDQKFQEVGDQAKEDIGNVFTVQRAELEQTLTDRGIYNSSVAVSLAAGLANAEAAELRRLEESLGAAQIQVYQAVLMTMQGDKRLAAQNQMQLGMALLQWKAQMSAWLSELYKLAPGIIERRTDIGPTLADIANLVINVGRGQGTQELLGQFAPAQFIQQAGGMSIADLFDKK
jgi:hypothetical protein